MSENSLGQDLLKYHYKNYKWFIYDFETEGVNLHFSRPWEIGYKTVENGKVTEEKLSRIFWPDLNISEDAKRITNFSEHEYNETALPAIEVFRDIEEYFEDDNWIVMDYNGLSFDMFIYNTYRRCLGKDLSYNMLRRHMDLLPLCRGYRKEEQPPKTKKEFFFWQQKFSRYYNDFNLRNLRKKSMKGTTLIDLAKEFDCQPEGQENFHSGLFDVQATWNVFEKLLWKMDLTKEHVQIIDI